MTGEVSFAANGSWFSYVLPEWIFPLWPPLPQGPNSFSTACLWAVGAPPPLPPAAHPLQIARKQADTAATLSSQRAGARQLPGKRRQNSHGATGRSFFKKGSAVTVWWQESHLVSFPRSHNNPAPGSLLLRAQNVSLHHGKITANRLGVSHTVRAR